MFGNDQNKPEGTPHNRRRRRRLPNAEEIRQNQIKKEPTVKPWGKTERLIVLGFLLISSFVALSLAVTARNGKLPGLPRVGSTSDLFTDKIVVENNEPFTPAPAVSNAVSDWQSLTKDLSGIYGFELLSLATDQAVGIHDKEQYTAASLIKLPVLFELYRESEQGTVNLDQKYTLRDADKVGGSGSIQYKKAGTVYTYRQLAEAMGHQSDNTAFHVVVGLLGDDAIKQAIVDIGMRNTDFDNNLTTPEDIAICFRKIWQAKLISLASRDEILKYLTKTIYEDHLAAGIPDGVRVAHKYGREVHVVNDAGIVFTDHPFVEVIMTKGVVETEADKIFPTLSKLLYDSMTK